jgi:hypothetical protein
MMAFAKALVWGALVWALLAGAWWVGEHRVYGNCHQTIEGRTCDLLGYDFKGDK